MSWQVPAPGNLDLLGRDSVTVPVACDCEAFPLQRFEKMLLDVVGIVVRVFVGLKVDSDALGPVLSGLCPLGDQVVRVLAVHSFDSALVQKRKLLVNLADTRQVIRIQQIHAVGNQAVYRVVVVENALLLLVPVSLGRHQTDVVDPVATRLKSNNLDVFLFDLHLEGVIGWAFVFDRVNVFEDVGVDLHDVC